MMNLDPPNMDICNETEHKLSISYRICSNKCVLLTTAPITVMISLRIQLPGCVAHCKLSVILYNEWNFVRCVGTCMVHPCKLLTLIDEIS